MTAADLVTRLAIGLAGWGLVTLALGIVVGRRFRRLGETAPPPTCDGGEHDEPHDR